MLILLLLVPNSLLKSLPLNLIHIHQTSSQDHTISFDTPEIIHCNSVSEL